MAMFGGEFDFVETADNLLARWDSAREHATSQTAADREFRVWLMRTMPELAEATRPDPDNERSHCMIVAATVERCVSLRRFKDALVLGEWLVDAYVPRGDDLSRQTISGSIDKFAADGGNVKIGH